MNTRIVVGTALLWALPVSVLPVVAQPDPKPADVNELTFPRVSPEDAGKLVLTDQPIKLHLRDVTLAEAFKQLQEQSGFSLDTRWNGEGFLGKKLSLDIETRSFSEAFRAVLDEANVKAKLQRFNGGAWQVMFGQEEESVGRPQSGTALFPIRVLNLRSSFSRTVTPGKDKTPQREQNNTLSVAVQAVPDQQLPVVGAARIKVTRAEDEHGHSLLDQRFNPFPFGFDNDVSQQSSLPLRMPAEGSQKLAHLEGVATYVLSTKRDKWEVPDVLKAQGASHTFQSAGETITASIQGVQKQGAGIQLDFQLRGAGAGVFIGFGGQQNPVFSFSQLRSSLYLVDADGQKLSAGSSGGNGGNGEMKLQVQFYPALPARPVAIPNGQAAPAPPVLKEPVRLVLDSPTEFVQTQVPFSFSDLPLP